MRAVSPAPKPFAPKRRCPTNETESNYNETLNMDADTPFEEIGCTQNVSGEPVFSEEIEAEEDGDG